MFVSKIILVKSLFCNIRRVVCKCLDMILQPCGVELTKVHYYDKNKRSQNMSVSTITREMYQNSFNKNVIIKKNIFGHKWVLKINEVDKGPKKKNSRSKIIVYVLVFCSFIVAVGFGIFFSFDHNLLRTENKNIPIIPTYNISILNDTDNSEDFVKTASAKNSVVNKSQQTMIVFKNDKSLRENDSHIEKISMVSENRTDVTKNRSTNFSQLFCHNCTKNQVCIKIEETAKPKCVKMADKKDPTGCGGLCKINTEYCKNLDKDNIVFQCLRLKHLLKCPENSFNCGNMCVSMDNRCNGKVDCSNMTDEENCECNLETHFHCGNSTSCIEKEKRCNGIVDCWDKSDEIHCDKAPSCEENQVPCLNGQCIGKEKFCDKNFDCRDKSDEPLWCQMYNKGTK